LTVTGDLIGTLRYMSPEQALARRIIVDHRTDIYSLGATLYELLTLEPAYTGNDRQELLRQIAIEEPKPPRRIKKSIPPELETIVQKTMEKNPADRYATASDLADDLRRYLLQEPIRAKKPTFIQRAGKWSRRHPAFVRSAVLMLFSITAGSVLSTWLIWQEKERTGNALKAEATARDRAEEQRRQARKAVDTMYTQVAEKWLNNQPGMEEQQREFLTAALDFYKQFSQEESTDPEHRFQTALAYQRVAKLQEMVFREDSQAKAALLQAINILEQLSQEFPAEPAYVDTLANSYFLLGWATSGNIQEEERCQRQAASLWEQLVASYPSERMYRKQLGMGLLNLSNPVRNSGRRSEAEMICRRAIAVLEAAPKDRPPTASETIMLACSYDNLAESLQEAGRLQEALDSLRKAIGLELPLAGKNPDVPEFQLGMNPWEWMNFGTRHSQVGDLLRRIGKCDEASPFIERSIRIHEQLAASFPKTSVYAEHLHWSYVSLGRFEQARAHTEAAQRAHKEALRIAEQLSIQQPALGLGQLAGFLLACPDPKLRDPQRASHLAEKLAALRPENQTTWKLFAMAKYRTEKYQQALEAAEKAKRYGGPEDFSAAFIQAMAFWRLGEKEKARRCYQAADQWLESTHPGDELLCIERDEAAALLGVNNAQPRTKVTGPEALQH
jgi:tetratricopeptide (TPR) repeat protein